MSARMPLTLGLLAWTLLAHDAGAQTLVPTLTDGTGRVDGRVTSTRAGSVADATISLRRVGSPDALTARSDQQGGFTFDRLAAGRYHVSASKPGYTSRQPIRFPASRLRSRTESTCPVSS